MALFVAMAGSTVSHQCRVLVVVLHSLVAGGSQAGTLAGRGSGGKPPPRPGSIASTYWREERTDRKNLLTVIDEK